MTDLANQIERLSAAAKGPWLSSPGDIAWFIEQGCQEYIRNDLDRTLRNAVPQIVAALRAADEAEALRARAAELEQMAFSWLAYDQLLRAYAGPKDMLCEGDFALADKTYDECVKATVAALKAKP